VGARRGPRRPPSARGTPRIPPPSASADRDEALAGRQPAPRAFAPAQALPSMTASSLRLDDAN
jgi:hypothetical protein